MHTKNLTGPGEHPTTNEDHEDEHFAIRIRISTGVQKNAIERENRTVHHNRDMEVVTQS